MLRKTILIAMAFAFSLSAGSASAASDKLNLSKAKCENEKIVEIIKGNMKKMRLSNGRLASSEGSLKLVGKPKTKSANKNTLICNVKIKVSSGGEEVRMRATYTFKQLGNDQMRYTIKFGY